MEFEDGAILCRILPSKDDVMVFYNGSFFESPPTQIHHHGQCSIVLGIHSLGSLDT